ncbi:MAG TPA: dihydrolipoyl dehydrogenase [Gaiellaceae bacterium]|jgi:dihydrolipoamide dehydrogenase|nr:dihydrolipoyl dehydrogenase [Gaiellaceae bacterium]
MEFDVAVLGGGPAGYTAAIRAAQLGARVACVEREAELGGTCLRIGCIPTKAWVSTAHALHAAREINAKLGVRTANPELDFAAANEWKAQVVKQMTGGVASLFKANNVTSFQGSARFEDARSFAFDKGDLGISFKSAIVATGSYPVTPPIPGLESPRCVDSTGLLSQTEVPRRLVVLGGGIIGCEFASIFERFGTEVTIVEMLETLIPQEDSDATSELRKSFARRGIVVHLGKQCTKVEETASGLVVHFGENETVECDLMLVSVGRAPLVEGIGLEAAGVTFDPRAGVQTDAQRRTSVPHIYAAGDVAGYWQLAHTAFREGEVAAENAAGHEASMPDSPAVPRPIYTDPEIAGVGLTEAEAVERYGAENIAVGRFPWVANARAVMTGETAGWVKSIHETTYGELVGVVIVGTHATDLIGAAVVALDSEATIETVADGIAPHPTLSEGLKEAGLVALGRPIHLPPRRR